MQKKQKKINNLFQLAKLNRVILCILLIAGIVRFLLVIVVGDVEFLKGDAKSYDNYAINILENSSWLTNADFPGHYRAPGYPFFLATVYTLFGKGNYKAVFFIQGLLNLIMIFYVYRFCKEISNEKTALLSLVWSSVFVLYLYFIPLILRETLVCFLFFLFFYYLYRFLLINTTLLRRHFIGMIVLFVLLIHTDPRYLYYIPFLSVLFIFYSPSYRIGLKKYSLFVIFVLLLLIPWSIRNYLAYGGLVIINTRTFDSRETKQMRLESLSLKKQNYILSEKYPTEKERVLVKKGLNPQNRTLMELEAIKQDKRAANDIKPKLIFNFIGLWKPFRFSSGYRNFPDGRFYGPWSLNHNISSIICYGTLLPFMIFSIGCLVYKKKHILLFLLFPLIIQTILHTLQWGRERYRVPIDAFVIILGTMGIIMLLNTYRKSRGNLKIPEKR